MGFREEEYRGEVSLSHHISHVTTWLVTDDVNLDHLVSARFLCCQITISPFPYSVLWNADTRFSPHLRGRKFWNEAPEGGVSTYISWNSSGRKICPFLQREHFKLLRQVCIVMAGINQHCPGPPWDVAELTIGKSLGSWFGRSWVRVLAPLLQSCVTLPRLLRHSEPRIFFPPRVVLSSRWANA